MRVGELAQRALRPSPGFCLQSLQIEEGGELVSGANSGLGEPQSDTCNPCSDALK